MENSLTGRLARSFSSQEKREIRRFLNSPFFNQRRDVAQLFDLLASPAVPDKESARRQVSGVQPVSDAELRLRMTYLHRLLEQYIWIKEMAESDPRARLYLLSGYRRRELTEPFLRTQQKLEKQLTEQPLRDARFFQAQSQLHWEAHQLAYAHNPTDLSHLQAAATADDIAYLIRKLRFLCLQTAHQTVYQADVQPEWEKEAINFAEKRYAAEIPAVAVYLHCYRMLAEPAAETHFQHFKKQLFTHEGLFPADEIHGLYLQAVNYCVRRLNSGQTGWFREVLDLYKAGLEKGYAFENGILSRYAFSNIAAAGLHSGELDWVRYFINEYKNRVEKKHRESAFSFNLARLEYASGNHGHVLELLQKANYRDPLLNLAAKTLLLKTWYELDEADLLQAHLNAMRNYIHRKRVLGYHRTNYLNIIRYTEKLLKLNNHDKEERTRFRAAVEAEAVLTEKSWFLEIASP